jgi:hypothetical protein
MEELFFELIQRHDEPGAARAAERTTVRDRGTAQTRETTHTLEAVQTRETVHDRGTAHHREAAKDTAAEWQAPTGRDTAH